MLYKLSMSVCLTVLIFHQNPQIFISSFGQSIVNETLDPFLHWHLLLLFCIFIGVHLSKRYMFPRVWRRIIRPGDILACKAHTFLQYLVDSTNIFLFYIWYSYMHVFFCGPFVLAFLLQYFLLLWDKKFSSWCPELYWVLLRTLPVIFKHIQAY